MDVPRFESIKQVFRIPAEDLTFDCRTELGRSNFEKIYCDVSEKSKVNIQMAYAKDESLTFIVNARVGKINEVLETRHNILLAFKNQTKKHIFIPKEHHKWIEEYKRKRELEISTGTEIHIPSAEDQSDMITITGITKEGIENAEHEVRVITDGRSRRVRQGIKVPKMYHPFIYGAHNENLNQMIAQTGASINIPPPSMQKDEIAVAGENQACVSAAIQKIKTIFEDMAQRCTTVSIEVPKSRHKYVIGPQGSNIAEILQLTGVSVEMPSPKSLTEIITLRGLPEKLGLAMNRVYEKAYGVGSGTADEASLSVSKCSKDDVEISGTVRDLNNIHADKMNIEGPAGGVELAFNEEANIVTEDIALPPQYCDSLKRTGRKLIQSIIADCAGTSITFPTAASSSDKVSITGPKDNVERAKQQLLESSNKTLSSSEVRLKDKSHRLCISRDEIKKISESCTGVRIILPTEKDDDKEVITIIGQQDAVDKAKSLLETMIKKIPVLSIPDENRTVIDICIESQHHGYFLARRGEAINKIIEECGEVLISFPHTSAESDRVVIRGAAQSVNAAKKRLLDIVHDLKSRVTIECEIPRKYRPVVMGTKGCKLQRIKAEFDVYIRFPDRFEQEKPRSGNQDTNKAAGDVAESVLDCDIVKIIGLPDNAEAAKQALLGLVPITIKVDVPNHLHGLIIGRKGRDVRELMEKFDVQIVLSRPEQPLDYVTISGIPLRVNEAKEAILEKCKILQTEQQERLLKSYALKVEVDSEYHPKIIGRSGAVIKKISSDYDVVISFPRIGDAEENIVTITGYEKNVHDARDYIMKIVDDLDQKPPLVFGELSETQDKEAEVSSCESPCTPLIATDVIGCGINEVEKATQDLSNELKDLNNEEDDVEIKYSIQEAEGVQTEMQKLHEKLNISRNSMSLIREHTNVVTDTLKYFEDGQKRLTQLYNNEILEREGKMKGFRKQLDDQVSTNKALEVEHARVMTEIISSREKYKRIICENIKKHNEETTKLSDRIKNIESKLNTEREEKSNLVAKNNQSLESYEELLSKHQELQVTSREQQIVIECLKSSINELKQKETRLTKELYEWKRTHCSVIADVNSKSIDYRKQLEDLQLVHTKTTVELSELISRNAELSNTISNRVQDDTLLKTRSKIKDDEISKLNVDLSEASKNNMDLFETIQSLRAELVTKENEISQMKREFETYKANVDQNIIKDKANHEAKLQKIKSNVFDLKEKLFEITQDIHSSSEICDMLNEPRNTSKSQTDNAEA